ncbi:alcohol dehydrogenase zinc-binding domain protein [Methylocaldum marinum]|uniref:Alcohol dehydrogenase zinc-binding domain protein n=1 Tax=Methylocaldum marinum TaxID=1432792 RepID=A0A250KVZ4_9GAMM|nr:zinc-binding alcohol dehydrogenase [Methylocaldum marinum]BBA35820.1 alcohol dehydrogenase zinc-binding domain protein [Methylocaldum marinum]
MRVQAVYHVAPQSVAIQEIDLPAPRAGELLIKALCSAISPGTESLIFRGGVPANLPKDTRIGGLEGDFGYPFRYGYALVGEVAAVGADGDRDWLGQRVFAYHPHQNYAVVDKEDCLVLPEDVPAERALFLANMESALNLVFDAAPLPGERIMVFGQGIVGLLTTAILSRFPLGELITAEPLGFRRQKSTEMGAALAINPTVGRELAALKDCLFYDGADGLDAAIEVSGNASALNQAIELTGFSGRIVIGSWYGESAAPLEFGSHFHRQRIRLISSQVSTIDPQLSGRWNKKRRLDLAWEWLAEIRPERLITHHFAPSACQEAFELVESKQAGVLQPIFEYI